VKMGHSGHKAGPIRRNQPQSDNQVAMMGDRILRYGYSKASGELAGISAHSGS
jgi:hypothetical protein